MQVALRRAKYLSGLLALLLLSGCSSLLYYPNRTLYMTPSRLELEHENFEVLSTDGVVLHGWYLPAELAKGKTTKGTVVHFHGNAQNLSAHFLFSVWLVKAGYDVYTFDYRGYGLSIGASPSPRGTVEDGKVILRYVNAIRPSNRPLIVFAQSLGGAIAMRSLIELENELQADYLLLDSTFASYQGVGRKILARTFFTWPFQWLAFLALSDRYAPESGLAKIHTRKTIVVHGDKDEIISTDLGRALYEELPEPKEFWLAKGAGHTESFYFQNYANRQRFLRLIESTQ